MDPLVAFWANGRKLFVVGVDEDGFILYSDKADQAVKVADEDVPRIYRNVVEMFQPSKIEFTTEELGRCW